MTNRTPQLKLVSKSLPKQGSTYQALRSIDGSHPYKSNVPGGHVAYRVRRRKNGKIAYFNFDLARELGFISADHPEKLNPQLIAALLDTFAIQIINEYDIIHETPIDPDDIKPNTYMATRYLQLQHQSRTGITSGDGRSLWNGYREFNGKTWDISSCGTGATCLSPATAQQKKFFRTGDPTVSYGCGYSDLVDGIEAAVFSEILWRNGIETERTLAVLEFPGNLSINVRAGLNLLRPSHFFNHLKQGQYGRLKAAIDYFIDRQLANKTWKPLAPGENRYQRMVQEISTTFARMAAKFESTYIFCWLAWDGDNILTNGGIIDYGSVRQFGLFHHEYRFDDVQRWSTTITEQKAQARYIVQTFIQIADYLNSKRKKPIRNFSKHEQLRQFDRTFTSARMEFLLERVGFSSRDGQLLMQHQPKLVQDFDRVFSIFERTTSSKPLQRVADGISKDAVFSMRDILRELPKHLQASHTTMEPKEFMGIIKSSYATRKDAQLTLKRRRHILTFQALYLDLLRQCAALTQRSPAGVLREVCERSQVINRYARVTGDSVCHIGSLILRKRKDVTTAEMHKMIKEFVEDQILVPENRRKPLHYEPPLPAKGRRFIKTLMRTVRQLREGL